MTDLEITKLCAEAMGLEFFVHDSIPGHWKNGLFRESYDPLHDDAQAMAMVKKFRLQIGYRDAFTCGIITNATYTTITTGFNTIHSELNRAICECVARMQQAKCAPR